MLKNIIVTGGAGFIGSNLTLELQARFPNMRITVIDDFRSASFKNLETFRGDVIAKDLSGINFSKYFPKAEEVDAVFHLASITDTTNHDELEQTHDNVESWRNILNHFAGKKTRLIYASSAATYGITSGINRLAQPLAPANVYAFSKVQLENLAALFSRENPEQRIIGLRFFNVYGPRESHKKAAASMIYQLAQQMKAGKNPRVFKMGEQKRDFVYVDDIVYYNWKAATEEGLVSGVYNAGSGIARSFNDIVTNLNRTLKLSLSTEYFDNPYPFYQPHTEAEMTPTRAVLNTKKIDTTTLEQGIDRYQESGLL